jgi:Spy/CpxP family protein refolding chaperone
MIRRVPAIVCGVMVLSASVTARAQLPMPPPQSPRGLHDVSPPPQGEILNLSDQQKQQIKKLHEGVAEKELSLRNQLGEKEARLRTLTTAKKVDEAEVGKIVDEISALRHQLFKSHVSLDLKIRELLTDEQRILFDMRPRPQGPPPPMM